MCIVSLHEYMIIIYILIKQLLFCRLILELLGENIYHLISTVEELRR